jgi:hypothetical protein
VASFRVEVIVVLSIIGVTLRINQLTQISASAYLPSWQVVHEVLHLRDSGRSKNRERKKSAQQSVCNPAIEARHDLCLIIIGKMSHIVADHRTTDA